MGPTLVDAALHGIVLEGTLRPLRRSLALLAAATLLALGALAALGLQALPAAEAPAGNGSGSASFAPLTATAPQPPRTAAAPPAAPASVAGTWTLHPVPPGLALADVDQLWLDRWQDVLASQPGARALVIVTPGTTDDPPAARLAAAIVRRWAEGGIDPHRISLLILPAASRASLPLGLAAPDLPAVVEIRTELP